MPSIASTTASRASTFGRQSSSRRALSVDISGTPSARSIQPTSVGCSAQPPGQVDDAAGDRGRERHRLRLQGVADLVDGRAPARPRCCRRRGAVSCTVAAANAAATSSAWTTCRASRGSAGTTRDQSAADAAASARTGRGSTAPARSRPAAARRRPGGSARPAWPARRPRRHPASARRALVLAVDRGRDALGVPATRRRDGPSGRGSRRRRCSPRPTPGPWRSGRRSAPAACRRCWWRPWCLGSWLGWISQARWIDGVGARERAGEVAGRAVLGGDVDG